MAKVQVRVTAPNYDELFSIEENTDDPDLEDLGGYIMNSIRTALMSE